MLRVGSVDRVTMYTRRESRGDWDGANVWRMQYAPRFSIRLCCENRKRTVGAYCVRPHKKKVPNCYAPVHRAVLVCILGARAGGSDGNPPYRLRAASLLESMLWH